MLLHFSSCWKELYLVGVNRHLFQIIRKEIHAIYFTDSSTLQSMTWADLGGLPSANIGFLDHPKMSDWLHGKYTYTRVSLSNCTIQGFLRRTPYFQFLDLFIQSSTFDQNIFKLITFEEKYLHIMSVCLYLHCVIPGFFLENFLVFILFSLFFQCCYFSLTFVE